MRPKQLGAAGAAAIACLGLSASSAGQTPVPAQMLQAPRQGGWEQSPYRNFGPVQPLLAGRVLLSDEAQGTTLPALISADLRRLSVELFEREGWRSPFAEGDPLRVYVARGDAGGVRQLVVRGISNGRLQAPAIRIDALSLSDRDISREVSRLFTYATLSAYEVSDPGFFTEAAADYLVNLPETDGEREAALAAAAAPELDLARAPRAIGRLFVEEVARAAGGPAGLKAAFERARERGEGILAAAARIAFETSGERPETIGLRFAARLYSSLETEASPSRIGLEDLQSGAFDTAVAGELALRHRTLLAADSTAALRVAWPAEGGLAAAVIRYRDALLPPDIVVLEPGDTRTIPLSGVARVDWVVEGGTAKAPAAPAFFERIAEFPYAGLSASTDASADGARLVWMTGSHEKLAGWAVFREQLLADGHVTRTGPQIVPSTNQSEASMRFAYVDPSAAPGTWYRYTVWAVTEDGVLARAFSSTLKTPE